MTLVFRLKKGHLKKIQTTYSSTLMIKNVEEDYDEYCIFLYDSQPENLISFC